MAAKTAGQGPNYGVIRFLHDGARPLTVRVTRQKLLDFGWEVLTPHQYRPNRAPKDFQLPLTLSNALQGKVAMMKMTWIAG
ncbi:hypothetical protein Y032_0012g1712 [Ancylostoma ceylanicum]|uniref:Uncharacterized protein n=1 Tax=Ancylostoma ceylanicum TaxID=53326 RepID=A0A016VCZ7_9BILA|nr:hypothetical protein Y032_0012g1712 [Ancylostoma ceylanicum]